jgi:uncharacterized protein
MKIAIISDTHLGKNLDKLYILIDEYLKHYQLVIHCGDYTSYDVLNILREKCNFTGVWGNGDKDDIKDILKEKLIIECEGYKIGVYHGHGNGKTTMERAYNKFNDDNVDIIAFGHSHQPLIKTHNKVLMLNPGSITNKRREKWFSYILLDINKDFIKPQLILIPNI